MQGALRQASRAAFSRASPPQRAALQACNAKKKGGKKKGGNQKAPSIIPKEKPKPWKAPTVAMELLLMLESYKRASGKKLLEESVNVAELADVLHSKPYMLLMHDAYSEGVSMQEAKFTYANQASIDVFEAESWEGIVGTPSIECIANVDDQTKQERGEALEAVLAKDEMRSVSGPRTTKKGSIFRIESAQLWTVRAPTEVTSHGTWAKWRKPYLLIVWQSFADEVVGQAVKIDRIQRPDGEVIDFEAPPTASKEDIAAQQEMVDAQAAKVRTLKEEQGKPNSDPDVQAAVAELLAGKEQLTKMQGRVASEAAEAAKKAAGAGAAAGAEADAVAAADAAAREPGAQQDEEIEYEIDFGEGEAYTKEEAR